MNLGKHFPVSDYYKDHIIDAETISNTGQWWTAVLLINDPKTDKAFTALYRWQKRDGVWKNSASFKLHSKQNIADLIRILERFAKDIG